MNPGEATFEIQKVYFITGRSDTFVAGRIKEGQVRIGMCAKALADGGLSMVARIKSIEWSGLLTFASKFFDLLLRGAGRLGVVCLGEGRAWSS